MFLGLLDPDPDPLVRCMDPDPDPSLIRIRIILSSCKNSKKNLDSYIFVTLFDFLSLKNDVNLASKSTLISRKIVLKNKFFAGILKVNDENSRIRIRIRIY
jgi:hypothetical protein